MEPRLNKHFFRSCLTSWRENSWHRYGM